MVVAIQYHYSKVGNLKAILCNAQRDLSADTSHLALCRLLKAQNLLKHAIDSLRQDILDAEDDK